MILSDVLTAIVFSDVNVVSELGGHFDNVKRSAAPVGVRPEIIHYGDNIRVTTEVQLAQIPEMHR
tara:strand:+ start:49 stop:243 length:195 start_codon:yes stop_codon:yes gene_type:complete